MEAELRETEAEQDDRKQVGHDDAPLWSHTSTCCDCVRSHVTAFRNRKHSETTSERSIYFNVVIIRPGPQWSSITRLIILNPL